MNIAQPTLASAAPIDAIPRDYNFAAAILKHNLDAGRGEKIAYIDPRGSWTYRDLAARVDSFGRALRALDIRREERVLICLLDSIDWPTAFLGAIKAGVVRQHAATEDDYRFMLPQAI
jgi:acyl-CoA synthetase (AMP-forming)/AMP-acid ligase II